MSYGPRCRRSRQAHILGCETSQVNAMTRCLEAGVTFLTPRDGFVAHNRRAAREPPGALRAFGHIILARSKFAKARAQ